MREELEPCPFCGTTASHGVVTEGGEANPDFGGHFIQCDNPNCHGCMGLRFACGDDPKPHLAAAWNTRAPTEALTERASMAAEIERLRADVARLREPHWFYLGDDCSSDQCRFGIDECISEDFEWDNQPKGNHVLQISGARPVPDMWVALHYFTEEEMDQRGDDEPYTYTVHTTEEEARAALEARP